jgi:hypothetical protein
MLSVLSLPFPDGETRTDLALKMANDRILTVASGDRPSVPSVLLLITHGRTGLGSAPYKEVLKQLKVRYNYSWIIDFDFLGVIFGHFAWIIIFFKI